MYSKEFLKFIEKSKTPFHATKCLANKLEENGFKRLLESEKWNIELGGKYYVLKNDSSIIAFTVPVDLSDLSFNITASHTDSPTFKVKPNHTVETAAKTLGMHLEVYGGTILSSWLDRPLSIAGRIVVREGERLVSKLVDINRPLCVIPNVAIHQNRSVNDGYKYNPAVDMIALYGSKDSKKLNEIIKEECNVLDNDIYGTDVTFGFHTAVDIATDAIDRLHTTAASHSRILICEIMGNKAGWLTVNAVIACGADVILIP